MKTNRTAFLFSFCFVFFSVTIHSQNVEKISDNQFQFTEGPVWDGIDAIYFSDIPASKAYKYSLSNNTITTAFSNTNRGNGMMFNEDEDLIVCEGGADRIQKRSVTGSELETLASTYNNKALNEPNDLCIDKKGGIYFTDPAFNTNLPQPQGTNRLYYRKPNGEILALLDYGNNKPNGVIISPDGTKLYINDSWSTTIRRYDINPEDGSISNETDFATLTKTDNSNVTGADGMAIDTNGNLYVTAKIGVQVFNASGRTINTISMPEIPTNCTFGGVNKDILFITAQRNLYKVKLPGVTGVRHPFDLPENPLSTNDNALVLDTNSIKVYPNPINKNSFFIDYAKKYNVDSITIIDNAGKKIENTSFLANNGKVEVRLASSLQSGIYLVTINTDTEIFQKKLMIK